VGLAVHAIGDAAVKMVLDCVERFDSQLGSAQAGAARRCRVRIEHAELIDKMDVPRFVRQRVDCSVQPCHLLTDIEALNRYVPHRLDRVLPLRELLDAGLQPGRLGVDWETMQDVIDPADVCAAPAGLVFGSDAPIVRPEPEDSIFAAVHRRRPELPESQAIAPLQALTEDECWKCFAAP
jgi:predicted amidohydrolase YtcJ